MSLRRARTLLVAAAALLALGLATRACADPDALWHIVEQRCTDATGIVASAPAPASAPAASACAVDHLILKDRVGALQYLLIPRRRITGIESPALREAGAPNFWAEAWAARGALDALRGSPLPREAVSLTVNSAVARSQNQLHLHISCVRAGLREYLHARQAAIGPGWTPLEGGWQGHAYQARRVTGDTPAPDPFRLLADELPGADAHMGDYTLGVVAVAQDDGTPGFIVLAGRSDAAAGDRGSAEYDLQDHGCAVLQ